MSNLNLLFATISAIVLFLFGLQQFSREIREVGGGTLNAWLARFTKRRWQGLLLGAFATAVIQSSSAVTSLAIALVDSGTISFDASLGILLGANIGTTSTAWLVSLKLAAIGPIFIVAGTALSCLPIRWSVAGKAVFYFGFILFSLELVGASLKPLQDLPLIRSVLGEARSPLLGLLGGMAITAVVQSSSITTGLAILLVQQGMLPAAGAIPIVIGSNIGTTSTGLLASLGMGRTARRTAVANLVFNVVGVLLFTPFLQPFAEAVLRFAGEPGMAVAWAQLIFNLVMAVVMLVGLRALAGRVLSTREPS
jgi:Na/Pi-cotransporter